VPKTTKVLEAIVLGKTDKHKEKGNRRRLCLDLAKKLFHSSRYFLLTQEQKNNGINY
jgi:hypothetical protein